MHLLHHKSIAIWMWIHVVNKYQLIMKLSESLVSYLNFKENKLPKIFRMKLNEWCFEPRYCTVYCYTGPGITWANDIHYRMNHAPSLTYLPAVQEVTIVPRLHPPVGFL